MKTIHKLTLAFVALSLLPSFLIQTQAQDRGFSYQAVARDGQGDLMANQLINVRFQIRAGNSVGTVIYDEDHPNTMTNDYGLFNLVIGDGDTTVGNDFSAIDWGAESHFLTVSINGTQLSTTELESVPYSKVATDMSLSALSDVTATSPDTNQVLQWNGGNWTAVSQWEPNAEGMHYNGGRIGIGTSSPSTVLDIESPNWQFRLNNPGPGGHLWQIGASNDNWNVGPRKFVIDDDGNSGSPIIAIDADNDNVGFGTGAPDANARVHVNGTLRASTLLSPRIESNSDVEVTLDLNNNNTDYFRIFNGTGASAFWVNENGDCRIYRRLGINEQTPFTDIHIKQSGETAPSSAGITLERATSNARWKIYHSVNNNTLSFAYNNTRRAWISNNNGVYQTSDRRLKQDIEPLEEVLSKVLQLRPTTYRYIQDESKERVFGFIAQEVQELFPAFVSESEDAMMGIAYHNFGIISIKAIQEQQQVIDAQQSEIESLKDRLEKLEAIISNQ